MKYWLRLTEVENTSLIYKCYCEYRKLNGINSSNWLTHRQNSKTVFNLEDVGQNNLSQNINELLAKWKYNIENRYKSEWLHALNANSDGFKLRTYAQFKTTFNLENYLLSIKCINSRNLLTKLQISAHDLLIETGRYTKPKKTPVENRLCRVCKSNNIEDEPHFILHCSFYNDLRKKCPFL